VGVTFVSDEVKTLITVLKGQIFLLGKDWDNLLDPEKRELAESAVETVSELNDLVRGKPEDSRFSRGQMTASGEMITHDLEEAMSEADVLALFQKLPPADRERFSRWIALARDDESLWRRIEIVVMALRMGPLEPGVPDDLAPKRTAR
jgi:molybdopterin converting factor small subunit